MNSLTIDNIKKLLITNKIFLLYGDVGAGKTHLIRQIIGKCVKSPTYSGSYIYNSIINTKSLEIWHCDIYLKQPTMEEILYHYETCNLLFIEWAQKLNPDIYKLLVTLQPISIEVKNYKYYLK